jgi:hypothetical protein
MSHGQLILMRFTMAPTGGKPPPSPLWYTLHLSMGATSKWLFVPGLPNGSPKIPMTRTLATLGAHNFACKPLIVMRFKASCSPGWELSNGMLHATYTQRNWVDFWLLVVRSLAASLTSGLSFDHNLCFKCLNGRCEPILEIYILIAFQWHKGLFLPMGFDPYDCVMKIQESISDSNSHNGSSLGSVKVHSLTFFTPESMWCDSWVSKLGCNFATPCFDREPKVGVTT